MDTNEYMTATTTLPAYLPYPIFLLDADLTQTAKQLYTLLLGRTTLSQKNGWMDENGSIYVVFPLGNLAKSANRGISSVKNVLNELEKADLIERRRQGFSMPSRIFVKLPPTIQRADLGEDEKLAVIEPENELSHSQKTDPLMDRKLAVIEPENKPSYSQKTGSTMGRKLAPNYLNINYMSHNYLKGASEKLPALGRYENVFLSEAELGALQTEFPDQWQQYIERLSEYMASTGKAYKNHIATIRRWAAADEQKSGFPDYSFKEGESL